MKAILTHPAIRNLTHASLLLTIFGMLGFLSRTWMMDLQANILG